MALPTSGPISWEMIRAEFGGSYPIQINQYYRGGSRVPNTPVNAGVPTSGALMASHFYGASNFTPMTAWMNPSSVYQHHNMSTTGTLHASSTINVANGTGSYSITNLSPTTPTPGVTWTRSGYTVSITATGRNVSREGSISFRVSDGVSSVDVSVYFLFDFGVLT